MGSPLLRRVSRFFRELKRRKVYRMTAVYVVLAVGMLEILDLLVPSTSLPGWASPLILSLAIVGLPIVLVLAWTFDITPGGVVRTADDDEEPGVPAPREGRTGHVPTAPEPSRAPSEASSSPSASPADPSGPSTHAAGATSAKQGAGGATPRRDDPDVGGPSPEPGVVGVEEDEGLDPLAVAVLPFDNLSGSPEAEPFAVGLHDDLLTELSRASALTVISRTSVRGYRGSAKSMRQIGRELCAGTIVEGGVQMAGKRVRLNVQLIDARTDVHRWAERYDRELTAETIFDLQSELAGSIMMALEAQLTAAEEARHQARPTDDLEAYRLYHLGREAFVDRSREGIEQAIELFEEAVERDPGYAHAWAGLGMALVALFDYGHVEASELKERGRAASFRAVSLNPDLPEAHAAVGNYYGAIQNGPAAREALSRATELGPGFVLGHQWSSWIALCTGRPEAALEAALRATRLDPLEPEARTNLATARLALGDAEQARAEAQRIVETRPSFSYARWIGGLAEHVLGRHEEAREQFGRMDEPHFQSWAVLAEGYGHAAVGREDDARAVAEELEEKEEHFQAAVLAAVLGDEDRFFSLVDRGQPLFWDEALALRYWHVPCLDDLRDDLRYRGQLDQLDRRWGVAD